MAGTDATSPGFDRPDKRVGDGRGAAAAALLFGALAVFGSSFVVGGIIFGILALACGHRSRRQTATLALPAAGLSTLGIILGWLGISISVIYVVAIVLSR